MGYLQELIKKRKQEKRDLKIIITARNSQTGTGKTTLATHLCRTIDNSWSAGKACFDLFNYSKLYDSLGNGSCIMLDEAELAADNRRGMSKNNVTLSQMMSTLRYRQVSTVATLPTVTMLDKRLIELADVRIIVLKRGVASVREITIDDMTGKIYQSHKQTLRWKPLDDDPDYEALCEMKDEHVKKLFNNSGTNIDDLEGKIKKLKKELDKKDREIKDIEQKKDRELKRAVKDALQSRENEIVYNLRNMLGITERNCAEALKCGKTTIRKREADYKKDNHITDALNCGRSGEPVEA